MKHLLSGGFLLKTASVLETARYHTSLETVVSVSRRRWVQSLERLQVLARLETYGFSGRDINFRTGSWIPADTGFPRFYREHPEAPQLNPIIGLERILHAIEYGIHCLFRFGLAHSRTLNDLVDKIEFDHWGLRISFINIFLTSGDRLGNGN
jgi:hypothetical protein